MSALGTLINKKIEDNTQGDVINIKKLARDLNFDFDEVRFKDSLLKGTISPPIKGSKKRGIIAFEERNSPEANNTLTALLLAKTVQKYGLEKVFKREEVDVFSLREIREAKMSEQMILATRLAIPEHIITKLDNDLRFDNGYYTKKSRLLSQFVGAAFHITGNGLFTLLDNLDVNVTITLNKLRVNKKTSH